MHSKIKAVSKYMNSDYERRTAVTSAVSALISIAFAIFNGVLGIVYHSLWNGSICVYYLLLAVIRASIVGAQREEIHSGDSINISNRRKIIIFTHLLLLLMNILLIVPITVMVKGERSYTYGLIPAIAMAAYTTFRVTMGVVQFRKSRKREKVFVAELRMINLTDALLALLSLQNALIIASNGMGSDMTTLSAWTSAGIFALILIITIQSFARIKKER